MKVGRSISRAGSPTALHDPTATQFVDPGWREKATGLFASHMLHFVYDVINSSDEVVGALSVHTHDTWMGETSFPHYTEEPLLPGERRRFEIVLPIPEYWDADTDAVVLAGLEPLIAFQDSVGLWWERSGHHGVERTRSRFEMPPIAHPD
ncbi:hypothetical protein [Rathayibacter festucae]|uniref:hypothetical protein n=1 Tax=Rathayibacter festucae TaxID=110937 RepID=UPI002A69BDCE|nr:hypothetical protein [Rathayibacter festucae]MDY0914851.1 hypothetical protein [Rathayibacter festucae]